MPEPIDVAILTMNSAARLRECITSVYQNIPVKRLIIVDGFSTDETKSIIDEFQVRHGNIVFVQEKGTRATARQTAIKLVSGDWFLFVDSDVILSKDWFIEAQKQLANDVGALWGIEIWSVLRGNRILGFFERVTLKIFEHRGGTHDMLIRRETVADIKIPFRLHTYEDAYIKAWITQKGYRVLGVYEPHCIHFRAESVWTAKKHIELVISDLQFALKRPLLLLPYGFYSAVVTYQIVLSRFRKPIKRGN